MTGSWEAERRLDWLDDMFFIARDTGAAINRTHLQNYFGISAGQASLDLRRFLEYNPSVIYDKSDKYYRAKRNYQSVRNTFPARRNVWKVFQ